MQVRRDVETRHPKDITPLGFDGCIEVSCPASRVPKTHTKSHAVTRKTTHALARSLTYG